MGIYVLLGMIMRWAYLLNSIKLQQLQTILFVHCEVMLKHIAVFPVCVTIFDQQKYPFRWWREYL